MYSVYRSDLIVFCSLYLSTEDSGQKEYQERTANPDGDDPGNNLQIDKANGHCQIEQVES